VSPAPTLLDKVAFVRWAAREHALTVTERDVLEAIVYRVLGLEDAKPHNGWTTNGVLATEAVTTKRTVRRVLGRLEDWGLLKRTSVAGRGGRIYLHVPGIHGASERCKPQPLGDRTCEDAPSKRGHSGPLFTVEKRTRGASKRGHGGPLNPSLNPSMDLSPSDRARGGAAEPNDAGAAGGDMNEEGEGEGLLTQPRARLLARLKGIACKGGADFNARDLAALDADNPGIVSRWLRLQREGSPKADARLLKEAAECLPSILRVNPSEFCSAIARKGEPPPPDEPPPEPPPRPAGARKAPSPNPTAPDASRGSTPPPGASQGMPRSGTADGWRTANGHGLPPVLDPEPPQPSKLPPLTPEAVRAFLRSQGCLEEARA